MSWHKITHIDGSETQYVAALDGIDLDEWDATPLNPDRCPDGHEEVDEDGNIFTPLEWARADLRARVNEIRDQQMNSTAPTSFGVVDNNDSSKIKMNGATTMAMLALQVGHPFVIGWTMADNSTVELTAAQLIQMGQEAGAHVAQVHAHAVGLKQQIEAATSLEDLDLIDHTTGWPGA